MSNPLTFASPHIPDVIGKPLDAFAASIGNPADQMRLVICLIAALPLGYIQTALPLHAATFKHIYSTVLGLLFSYFVVGLSFLHIFICAFIVYLLCLVINRKRLTTIVFLFSLTYLSGAHIYRVITDYGGWSLDFTMLFMIYCVKSHTLACNYADGLAVKAGEKLHEKEHIAKFRESKAIKEFPSLLEYFSFMFFYGGVLVGPAFEIKEYLEFIDGTMFTKAGFKSIPSTILPSLQRLGQALLCYVGIVFASKLPIAGFIYTQPFLDFPFWKRMIYYWFATCVFRCKYYFAWYMSEAGCIAAGLGFNGTHKTHSGKEKIHWNRTCNVNAWTVETAPSMPVLTNHWNMGVNNWLKNYVYFRVEVPKPLSKIIPAKAFQNIVTKLTSAFWHGFYPAYYLFFLSAYFVNEMDDAFRAKFEPIFFRTEDDGKVNIHKPKSAFHYWSYRIIGYILVMFCINYLGVSFIILQFDWSITFWKSVYFIGHIAPFVVMAICKIIPSKRRSPNAKKDENKAGTVVMETPKNK